MREGVREGEKHQWAVASQAPLVGGLACNPGMCPDWEWNQGPFGLQAGAQSTEPFQPGLGDSYKIDPRSIRKKMESTRRGHTRRGVESFSEG